MNVRPLSLPEILLIEPRIFRDDRGHFLESWVHSRYAEIGLAGPFVQDNLSISLRGVIRGLHFQEPLAQGKLVSCVRGAVYDVAVDVRAGSPTFGRWVGAELTDANHHQLWIPPGFAHGFQALADDTVFSYKCTERYSPETERSVRWDDPAIGIVWPLEEALLSPKDRAAPLLGELPADHLPRWSAGAR